MTSRKKARAGAPPDAGWLRQKYEVDLLGCPDIARLCGCDPSTVRRWLIQGGIKTRGRGMDCRQHFQGGHALRRGIRHTREARDKIGAASRARGAVPYLRDGKHWLAGSAPEDNPRWAGGVTLERQAFSNTLAWKAVTKAVYARERGVCQRCRVTQKVVRATGRRMHVHHVIPFASGIGRCDPGNLRLLCDECHWWVHSRANLAGEFMCRDAEREAVQPTLFDLEGLTPVQVAAE